MGDAKRRKQLNPDYGKTRNMQPYQEREQKQKQNQEQSKWNESYSAFREETLEMVYAMLEGTPIEQVSAEEESSWKRQHWKFLQARLEREPIPDTAWGQLLRAIGDLTVDEFCNLTIDNAPQSIHDAFVAYAKPHVDRGDPACIFEIGVADLALPGLVQEFYYFARLHFPEAFD